MCVCVCVLGGVGVRGGEVNLVQGFSLEFQQ